MHAKLLQSCPTLCDAVDHIAAHQALLSTGFCRQEYWSGLPFPSPVLHMVMYIVQCYSLSLSHLLLPQLCPKVCSLCLYSCPANRFKSIFFSVFHRYMLTDLEPDILECGIKWALESITTNKASGGDGIPAELFQILKDDAVKVLHSICQKIWKTQQWPQDWKRAGFIPIPKKGNAKECSNSTQLHSSHMLVK